MVFVCYCAILHLGSYFVLLYENFFRNWILTALVRKCTRNRHRIHNWCTSDFNSLQSEAKVNYDLNLSIHTTDDGALLFLCQV